MNRFTTRRTLVFLIAISLKIFICCISSSPVCQHYAKLCNFPGAPQETWIKVSSKDHFHTLGDISNSDLLSFSSTSSDCTDDFQFIILLFIIISFPFDRSFLKFFELAESEICEEQPEPVMAEYDGEFDYIEIKNENMTVYVAI